MRRVTLAVIAFVPVYAVAIAQDPKPAVQPPAVQPKAVPIQPAQPIRPAGPVPVTAAKMLQLEEEVETLEAHRDVKKAHVKAAEVAVRAAEVGVDRVSALAARGVIAKEEVDRARVDLEMAKAHVEIRIAEVKEVDVKIKYAKRRLEDAKAAGVRPAPVAPKAVDPAPPLGVNEKAVAELKAKIEKLSAEAADKADAAKKVAEGVKEAEERLAAIQKAAQLGFIARSDIEDAEKTVAAFKTKLEQLSAERKALETEIEALKKKLAELSK